MESMGTDRIRFKPMKCPSIRWRTSNMEYGKFYQTAALEAQSKQNLHAECERKREALTKELMRCKNELYLLRSQATAARPTLPRHEGREQLDKNAENSVKSVINGEEELVHRSNESGTTGIGDNSEKTVHPVKARRLKSKFFPLVRDTLRQPQSASSGGLMAKHKSSHTPMKVHNNNNKFNAVHSWVHPATRKYEFYKYYGFGGQGAKTSWGHNLPLGITPPYGRRARKFLT